MSSDISSTLRQQVMQRAHTCCEYCLFPQPFALHKHEPDHILPRQHGGETSAENLALACMRCNRYKGANVGSFDPHTGELVPFFNPRTQKWSDHFQFEGALIEPLTAIGRVTAKILRFNDVDRVQEREILMARAVYPPSPS